VPHGGDDGNARGGNRARQTLIVESEQIFEGAAAASYDDDVDVPVPVEVTDAAAHVIPAIPPQAAEMMKSMKTHTDSKMTGRTQEIRGIKAAEREISMTVDAPEGAPITGPLVRMVMQLWMAEPGEVDRIPAVREVASLKLGSYGALDPGSTIQTILGQMPGVGAGLKSMLEEVSKTKTVLLRSHVDVFMPMFATLSSQMPQGADNPLANFDANSPFMQMNQDVAELSTDPIPDSSFQVPSDYKTVPLQDLVKDMTAQFKGQDAPPQ